MKYLLSFIVLLFSTSLFAQKNMNDPYSRDWQKADSLLNSGFPESAAKVVNDIYKKAQQKGEEVQMLKAELFLLSADFQRSEEAYQEAITKAEGYAKQKTFPINEIWQSVAAQLYWNYYQQNRWQIMERTSVSSETTIEDFQQWDAQRFFNRISELYEASVSRAKELEQIDISKYDAVLIKGVNTRTLRPALLDLLAFRALSYFENDEKDLTKPAFAFTMNDAKAFAPANEFINHNFKTSDTISLQFKALKLYQRLLALHQNDATKDAFIDADLHRLDFVYRTSVLPNKTELYKNALENIENTHSSNPLSGLASVKIAELLMQPETQQTISPRKRGVRPPLVPQNRQTMDYRPAKEKLETVIAKFPNSEAGLTAKRMLQGIETKSLNITVEDVVLPNEPSRFLLQYKNIQNVSLKIVAIKDKERFWNRNDYYNEKLREQLFKSQAIKQWNASLPATEDLDNHSTELKIDALPVGMYAVIASMDNDFSSGNNITAFAVFQVSKLSAIMRGDEGVGYVLDRKNGNPLANVQIDFYRAKYNNKTYSYDYIKNKTVQSSSNGTFNLSSGDDRNSQLKLSSGSDELFLNGNFYYSKYNPTDRRYEQTFFFTDRAIYRPGQTIFFKGILIERKNKQKDNNVIPNRSIAVTFTDVNGSKIETKNFTTNEFGSFSGSFVIPEGLLTGNMQITTDNGSTSISVEEYKRPKFFVAFDTLKKDYALNDDVTVTGKASAYAGNNVDGAEVKYRVARTYYFPYYWASYYYRSFYPQTSEMEIANGTTKTDAQGNFEIDFKTIPDLSIDPKSLPIFTYTVTADVTDINGETRSSTKVVRVGYTSLNITASIPENISEENGDKINIQTQNLNGDFVAADVTIKISKLKMPSTVLRKRLWEMPDQFAMDSISFKKDFPNDVYKNEDEKENWAIEKTVLEKSIRTTKDGNVAIDKNSWKDDGWYVIELKAKDKNGKEIIEKKYTQSLRDETNEPLVLINKKDVLQPGETADVKLISGYDNLHLIRVVNDMNQSRNTDVLTYDGNPITWTRKITEADRGGVMVSYITVKENRVYTRQVLINVPWSNKDLNISWETHRDKLQPGAEETWTMVVSGDKKEKVAAEMVATLYDASLDAFREHRWSIYDLFPRLNSYTYWNSSAGFGQHAGNSFNNIKQEDIKWSDKRYDELNYVPNSQTGARIYTADGRVMYANEAGTSTTFDGAQLQRMKTAPMMAEQSAANAAGNKEVALKEPPPIDTPPPPPSSSSSGSIQVRKNLQETAFFLPQLKTDAEGNIRITFTMPEALTEWKMMAFAHTKDMKYGFLNGAVKTQKDLMVMPNLPRFMRQGDEIELTTKINNLSDKDLSGVASIEILNALTNQPVDLKFRIDQKDKNFSVVKGQSSTASWTLHVPETLYEPVIVRIIAKAGTFTDGEENVVPVITNRMLVTETLPLWINGNGTKEFSFDKLLNSSSSTTLSNHALTLEYTGNPAWYAVQALPYMMEYPYECAEQTFNRYYATALAAHIVDKAPKVKAIFEQWKNEADQSSLKSPLEKNQELKSALLEETPWVMEAKNETEQRKRIAELFNTYKLSKDLDATMKKLMDKQMSSGAFGWFEGMYADRFITQYIVTGLAKLQKLGVQDSKENMNRIISKALPYLDHEIKNDYDNLVKSKAKLETQQISYTQVQYLYMRSFLKQAIDGSNKKAYDYYFSQANKYWSQFNPIAKGMIGLALHRGGNTTTPIAIIQSLRETSIKKEEMGMYWVERGYGYWWYEAPIETQSLMIECFNEVDKDVATIDKMKIWLLKNKQTNNWETTKATADACYAMLLTGTDWLQNTPKVTIQLGDKTVKSEEQKTSAGTGYFKMRYNGEEMKSNMGNIKLTVSDNPSATSWGAVYWQYFENLDKITTAKTPLEIKKQLFIERNTTRGPELIPITENNVLKVGDKVKARIEIIVDRDMEYVHLKDMRASCFEPTNVMSSYKYQNGLGYYESTKDVSTNFFFDHLRKGKYVFEYPMFVQQKGNFSNGIATIKCMYAPEFSSHSEGMRVMVK